MRTFYDEMTAVNAELAQKRAAKQAEKLAAADAKAEAFESRTTPMAERLQRIIRDLPDDERDKPRHIRFFTSQLKAKFGGGGRRAAMHEVGPALASLGWERRRLWLGPQVTIRTWWFPPTAPGADEVQATLKRARQESSAPKQRRKRVEWTPDLQRSLDRLIT